MPSRRDPRAGIYAALDFIHVAAYLFLLLRVAPPLSGLGNIFWLIVALFALAGGGTLIRRPWGWRVAVGGCALLLALEVVLLTLILSSAAFLASVYGSFGRAGSGMAVLAAFLSIQVIALVPALQLKFLLTRAGRAAFGRHQRTRPGRAQSHVGGLRPSSFYRPPSSWS